MNALRAELLKAVTTRLLLWFGLGLLAFLLLVLSIHIGSHDLLSLSPEIRLCPAGTLERAPGKAVRVVDRRPRA